MDIVLPKELAYAPSLPSLPECTNTEVILAPVNGATFGASQLIQFDLPARGMCDPASMYLRYKVSVSASGTPGTIPTARATPLYSFFSKHETIIGSQIVESINNYGQVCCMWNNLTMDVAQKYGAQFQLGLTGTGNDVQDGYAFGDNAAASITLAGVFPNIIQSCEKLVPLEFMPNVRLQLTTSSIAEVLNTPGNATFTISNVELVFNQINFTGDVYNMVKGMGEKFYLKSQSWANMGASVASGLVGTAELVYNARYSSIKSLFSIFTPNSPGAVNGIYDSVDLTSNSGSYQFSVAGTNYPSRELSTLNNKAGIMAELRKAVGGLYTGVNSTSINRVEFSYIDSTVSNAGGTGAGTAPTTIAEPSKFIVGCNVEKLSTNGALLTGISTQNSAITLRIQNGTATRSGYTVYLVALYDALLEIEPLIKNTTVKQ